MGGEQAATVLATVAKAQRAREGKQVNAIYPQSLSLAFRYSEASEQCTQTYWRCTARWLHGSGVQCAGPGFLEDADLEVVSGIWILFLFLRAISFEVPFCHNLQNFQNPKKTLQETACKCLRHKDV